MASQSDRVARLLRVAADAGILLVVALILVVVFRNRGVFFPRQAAPEISVGAVLAVPGVDWGESRRSFVLALSTHCGFCTQSAEFYRTLANECGKSEGARVVALFPEPVVESTAYLDGLGIRIKEVVQVDLSGLRIAGTPTILLTDSRGRIMRVWRARLNSEAEIDVLKSLTL